MKQFYAVIVLCLSFGPTRVQNSPNYMDSVSYALGVLLSQNLKSQGFDNLNADEFSQGFGASLAGNPAMDPQAANALVQSYMQKKQEAAGAEARKGGESFLAENAKRPEVKVTDSGLQYEVLKEGSGASPTATETVEVHYHGTLIDGTVFDSSVERGQTIEFPLNRVIPGWTEGVQLMKEGAKYRFFIPFDLAYGAQGSAPKIPPYAALVFDVELFKVK